MPVCRWCNAELSLRDVESAGPCPRCGRRPAEPASLAGREPSTPSTLGDFDDPAPGGALELDLPMPARGVAGPTAGATRGSARAGDPSVAPGPVPTLDLPPPVSTRRPASAHAELARQLEGSGDALEIAMIRPKAAPSTAPAATELDRYEVLALADYGPEPRGWVQLVPYAIRVKLRQRELRRAMAGVRAALAEAEARRDERYVELGEVLRPLVATHADLRRFGGSLEAAERTHGTRQSGLADADARFQQRVGAVDKQIAELEAPLASVRSELERRRAEAAAAEGLRQKHEARRKRVEIEVRAAEATLQSPQATAQQRQQAEARIAAARQEKDVRAAEETIATTAAQESEARATASGRSLQATEERIAALRAARREVEREFSRQGEIRSEGIEVASREVRQALLELGKSSAATAVTAPGADVKRKGIADGEASVRRLQLDLERHLRALDAANAAAVRRGLTLLVVALVVLVGGFVAWRTLRTNPYLDEHTTPHVAP